MADRAYPEPTAALPRAVLEGWLEYEREGVLAKADGLSDEAAARSPVASSTSVTGVIAHLALVEDYWFSVVMAHDQEALEDDEFAVAWTVTPTSSLSHAMADYRAACQRSRAVQSRIDDLSSRARHWVVEFEPYTYDYVLIHMIEETARHLGHLDILREWLDGSTGQ